MNADFTERISHLKPEGAYQVLTRASQLEKQGREIIHFEIGQPDFETPEHIRMAGVRAIQEGKTRYTNPAGMSSLQEAIAASVNLRLDMEINPQQVVVGPGAKPLLFFPTLALVEAGDEVIYPDPGFPTYEAMIRLAGAVPVAVPLLEEGGFSFNLTVFDSLVNSRTRLIILNSPGNPTGAVIPQADLEHIAAKAQEADCWVMSDEIYAHLVYDQMKVPSILSMPGMQQRTILVDGFSKTYAMTGWRLGFGIMPVELAGKVELLLTHSVGSTAHFTQFAGLEALQGDQACVQEMLVEYQRRRDVMVDGLNSLPGVSCRLPQGAFYAFPNIRGTGLSSSQAADLFLEKAGVALLPGTAFGKNGEGYLRLSYATSLENIERGLDALRRVF